VILSDHPHGSGEARARDPGQPGSAQADPANIGVPGGLTQATHLYLGPALLDLRPPVDSAWPVIHCPAAVVSDAPSDFFRTLVHHLVKLYYSNILPTPAR